ncbi:DUF6712 family protein [Rufibacter roseus]|uniref:DUF6712 family protein n=1 Tax=Rufibacter roseus TaxID=1567108 RepID=A0ABW2DPD7_9BACT|nr:DUF6712 family protein [Rufibacter roseus]
MKALFKTIEEFEACVPVATGFSLEPLMGDVLLVEDSEIRKFLGEPFHSELLEKYEAGTLEQVVSGLVGHLQLAVANLAMESYLAVNQVSISDAGVLINSDSTTKTAFPWQIEQLKESFTAKGFAALEKVLKYLVKHSGDQLLAKWSESKFLDAFKDLYILSASEFSQEFPIEESWLTLYHLLPYMRNAQRMVIDRQLGHDLAEELHTQIKSGELSLENGKLVQLYLRPAQANLAAAMAMVSLDFNLTAEGLKICRKRKPAETDDQNLLSRSAKAKREGKFYLEEMRKYLDREASETKYAAYFNSSQYTPPPADRHVRNQSGARTFRAF